MDDDRPFDLLRNLRGLIELDAAAGVTDLPRVDETTTAPEPAPSAVVTPVSAPELTSEPSVALDPCADIASDLPNSEQLTAIAERIATCQRCGLCGKTTVAGAGLDQADLVFIGEAPGAEEEQQGQPFVDEAGALLDKMIAAMGLSRDQVFLTNMVKCRPAPGQAARPDEIAACLPYLERQIDAIKPRIICTLGNAPLRALSGNERAGITRDRGQAFMWRGYQVIPTFHPSYLLRNASAKKPCWEDLKAVLAVLGRTPPQR
ncbi:MAG: uracil-DNA glycosylase [Planctomycetota bacterium]|jgi:DNA polymerase